MQIFQIPDLEDNYIHVLRCNGKTAVVDPSTAPPVNQFLQQKGWSLDVILNTHHHWDHVGGNEKLKNKWHCPVLGFLKDAHRIPGIDQTLEDNQDWTWEDQVCQVLFIPGHTLGHIALWFKTSSVLFSGDTLFSMGCGRLFEGTAKQMFESLNKLSQLPLETQVYCGHEYSEANASFALQIEGKNQSLIERMKKIHQKREKGESTVPFSLEEELDTNSFLRTKYFIENPESITHKELKKWITNQTTELELFTKIRLLKDSFTYSK